MNEVGRRAMVLAAGLGQRMRPLTDTRPKPLIEVAGRTLIDRAFDRLRAGAIEKAVVNTHYFPDQIAAWARRQTAPQIIISEELTELLDTGGGVAKALPLLGPDPFFVLNSDSFWIDGARPALDRMRHAWNGGKMDCLLLVCPLDRAVGFDGKGDFSLEADGRLARKRAYDHSPHIYIGCHLIHPRLFAGTKIGKFSMNVLWDRAIAEGRLFGLVHDGLWIHVGTPQAIGLAEASLAG